MSLALGVLGACAVVGLETSASSGEAKQLPCRVDNAEVLASNTKARLMAIPYSARSKERYIAGCAYSRNRILSLDDPRSFRYAFSSPALHLRGILMGGATNDCSDVEASCETLIGVTDLAAVETELVVEARPPNSRGLVKVGSLRITANGGVAWIACPDRSPAAGYVEARRRRARAAPGQGLTMLCSPCAETSVPLAAAPSQ